MKRIPLSRRAFLRLALLGGIAAAARVVYQATAPVGFDRWFGWMMRGSLARVLGPPTRVALAACPTYESDILGALQAAWEGAGIPGIDGARVVLKPNLVDYVPGYACYTHPNVVRAVIRWVRQAGAREVVVAEGTTFRRDAQAILDATGYTDMLAEERVPFVDLNYDDLVHIPLKGGYTRIKKLLMARTIADADWLLSIPKLKTHHWTTISASIKNLFGTVPGIKYGWPKNTLHILGIPAFLAELADSLPTRACAIVDGIVGLEGDGPIFGQAVPSGVLVVGENLLAVDVTCARLMGMNPREIDYLNFAAWAGIGPIEEERIHVVGAPLAEFRRRFEPPPA